MFVYKSEVLFSASAFFFVVQLLTNKEYSPKSSSVKSDIFKQPSPYIAARFRYATNLDGRTLVYNRVSKSGSEMLNQLLKTLIEDYSKHKIKTNITRFSSQIHTQRQITKAKQLDLGKFVFKGKKPFIFVRHVFFIDFREFLPKQPTYFNLVRDPVTKFISRFYYNRYKIAQMYVEFRPELKNPVKFKKWKEKKIEDCIMKNDPECMFTPNEMGNVPDARNDLNMPFFCGQWDGCRNLESRWALNIAKENIETFFPVVAILEEWDKSMDVMEAKLPQFFRGVKQIYNLQQEDPNHKDVHLCGKTMDQPSEKAKNVLRSRLTVEYELYDYLKQRLLRQWDSLGIQSPTPQSPSNYTNVEDVPVDANVTEIVVRDLHKKTSKGCG